MFGGIRVGRLVGIPFFVNPSWFLVFAFVTFSLASEQLPVWIGPGRAPLVYWALGAAVALVFFGSLLAHELGHSLVSRFYGIPVRSITLHLFGGVAQLGREVGRPREEFWIAIAGPAVSLVLGALFWAGGALLDGAGDGLSDALILVSTLNLGVLVFNMVPGFPLDGGRVLRAAVWGATGNYRKATRVASTAGRGIGLLMVAVGIFVTVSQGDLSSLWLALVGMFLISIARQSYAQAVVQDALQRTPVSGAQIRLISVPGALTLDELYAGYVMTTGRQYYLVEEGDRAVGVLWFHDALRVPRPLWAVSPLTGVARPIGTIEAIPSSASAATALNLMEEQRMPMLRTVEDGLTIGVVTQEQLLGLVLRASRTG